MTKTGVVTRVPKELISDADFLRVQSLRTEGKMISRMEALRRLRKKLMFGKKGQILDFFIIIIILVMALVLFGAVNFGIQEASSAMQESTEDATLAATIKEKGDQIPSWFDFAFAILFFLILIFVIIINLSLDSNIQLIVFYIFSLFFIGPMFIAGHNQLNAVIESMPTVFESFTLTNFIVNQFYIIMAIFYVFQFMIIFMKPTEARL